MFGYSNTKGNHTKLRVRYAQSWEDPRTLTQALAIGPDDDVISIASAGDNTLALLLDNPRSLTAIDCNPAQIFLVELKMRAMQTLDYDDFVHFIGARPCQKRQQLYSYVRPSLSDEARWFWDNRSDIIIRGIIHCGKLERYFAYFRRFVLPFIHRRRNVQRFLGISSIENQRRYYSAVWNNRRWPWLFRLFFGEFLLGRLGRESSFFRYVAHDDIAEELLRRTQRGFCDVAIQDNFFIEYILTGQYGNLRRVHPYLSESNFLFLKEHVGKVRLAISSLEEYLKSLVPGAISKFNLSDIFEYMSPVDFELTLQEILRTCRNDAKLAYWTLFVSRNVPPHLAYRIEPCSLHSKRLFNAARTFFYGSFCLWRLTGKRLACQHTRKVNTALSTE